MIHESSKTRIAELYIEPIMYPDSLPKSHAGLDPASIVRLF